jgi:hypothetical protein
VRNGFVALTPLRLDLTDHEALAQVRSATPLGAGSNAKLRLGSES